MLECGTKTLQLVTVSCKMNSMYTNTFCTDILCPNLLGLANGAITFQYPALATIPIFGTQVFHSCNDGYYLQGSAIRNCISDGATSVGVWDRNEPSCLGTYAIRAQDKQSNSI